MLRKIRMGWFNPRPHISFSETKLPKVDGSFDWGNSSSSDTPKDHVDDIVGFICNHIALYKYLHDIPRYLHELLGFIPIGNAQTMPLDRHWGCQQWRHAPHWRAPFESLAKEPSWWMVHLFEKSQGGIQQYFVYTYHIYIYLHIHDYIYNNISMMVGLFITSLGWSEGWSIFPDFSQKNVPNLWVDHHVPWFSRWLQGRGSSFPQSHGFFFWDPVRDPWSNPRDQRRLPKPPMMPEHLPETPQEGAKSAGSVSPGAPKLRKSPVRKTIFDLSAHIIIIIIIITASLYLPLHLRESVCWGWLMCCKYLWWYYHYIYIHIHERKFRGRNFRVTDF